MDSKDYNFPWYRSNKNTFGKVYGYYQALSCIENKKGDTLLDIGSNDGYVTNLLSKHFKKTVAIEPSKSQYEYAKSNYPNIEFCNCFLEDFETSELFDTISIIAVYNCIDNRTEFLKKHHNF